MGCSVECAKCLVIVFSIVYAIVGIASVSIGVYYFTQELGVLKNLEEPLKTEVKGIDDAATALTWGAFLFTITGVLEFVFAVIGICSAWKANDFLVKMFGSLLVVMFVVHATLMGLSFSQTANEDTLNATMKKISDNYHQYPTNSTARDIQHYFEEQYRCCGLDTYKDYDIILEMAPVPRSCCPDNMGDCGISKYQSTGCSSAVASKIIFHYKTVGVVSAIVAIIEVLGAIMTFYFVNTIKNEKRRGTYS